MQIMPGQMAPDFLMYDTEKQAVRLSELRGSNVVLLFFPFAFTSTCTKELCSVRDDIAFYNALKATVFGISVDAPYALKVFREQQNLNFALLSDFNKIVSETYGCIYDRWGMDLKGVSKRAAFVIDKDGLVQYAEVLEKAGDIPDFEAIQKILKTL